MIDEGRQLFPFCIVWTMLPCISWIFPFIGHTGICDSEGIINDFMGFNINKRRMSFDNPIKYVVLQPSSAQEYNKALMQTNQIFSNQSHNLLSNNCHHHVAEVLNRMKYQQRQNWTQVSIWWMCICNSSYISKWYIFKTYIPFVLVVTFIVFVVVTLKHS